MCNMDSAGWNFLCHLSLLPCPPNTNMRLSGVPGAGMIKSENRNNEKDMELFLTFLYSMSESIGIWVRGLSKSL